MLKSALGSAQIPPSQIITGVALILTIFVMAPTGERMYRAVEPDLGRDSGAELLSGQGIEALVVAADKAKEPLREFLLRHASSRDRGVFHGAGPAHASRGRAGVGVTDRDFLVLVPAFLASELRRAFEIGFLLFIPFLVVDLVISNLLAGARACTCFLRPRCRCPSSCCSSFWPTAGSFCCGDWCPAMSSVTATDLLLRAIREGLLLVLLVSAPPLLASVAVGLVMGVVQAASQISDQTLAFVPKLAAVVLVLLATGPLLGTQVLRFAQALLLAIETIR